MTLEQQGEEGGNIIESPPQTPVGGAHYSAAMPLPATGAVATPQQPPQEVKAAAGAAPVPADGASSDDVADDREEN